MQEKTVSVSFRLKPSLIAALDAVAIERGRMAGLSTPISRNVLVCSLLELAIVGSGEVSRLSAVEVAARTYREKLKKLFSDCADRDMEGDEFEEEGNYFDGVGDSTQNEEAKALDALLEDNSETK